MLKWRRSELGPCEIGHGTEPGVAVKTSCQKGHRRAEMCGECTDSGREATDSASLTSSQQSSATSAGCSACTDTSGATQSDTSYGDHLKVPNVRRSAAPERTEMDSLESRAGDVEYHSAGWGSAEHLATEQDVQRGAYPVRKTSSMDDLLDSSERPVRGILRKRLSDRRRYTPSRPKFIFSRYNPQFRTLPAPRRGQQQPCWPPSDLPVQKSFLSLQKFRRRPERGRARESRAAPRPTAADIAVLRHDLLEEARSLGYLSAAELGDVRYFSHTEIDAQYLSESSAEGAKELSRLKDVPPEHRAARQQRQLAAMLRDSIPKASLPPPVRQRSPPAGRVPGWRGRVPEPTPDEGLLEELVGELVNTPPTLKRWYQAVTAARGLGLILPLYRGLHDRLDPVTLAKLLFKVSAVGWRKGRALGQLCYVLLLGI